MHAPRNPAGSPRNLQVGLGGGSRGAGHLPPQCGPRTEASSVRAPFLPGPQDARGLPSRSARYWAAAPAVLGDLRGGHSGRPRPQAGAGVCRELLGNFWRLTGTGHDGHLKSRRSQASAQVAKRPGALGAAVTLRGGVSPPGGSPPEPPQVGAQTESRQREFS